VALDIHSIDENTEPFALVGLFVASFSAAETGLDLCNTVLFQYCGAKQFQPTIPSRLGEKIGFLRKCQTKCAKIANEAEWPALATAIANEFSALRDDRHFIIHGLGVSAFQNEGEMRVKLRHMRDTIALDRKAIPATKVVELIRRCFKLSQDTIVYFLFLVRFIPPDQVDKALSEIGGDLFGGLPVR
jgi:hypothetical protein